MQIIRRAHISNTPTLTHPHQHRHQNSCVYHGHNPWTQALFLSQRPSFTSSYTLTSCTPASTLIPPLISGINHATAKLQQIALISSLLLARNNIYFARTIVQQHIICTNVGDSWNLHELWNCHAIRESVHHWQPRANEQSEANRGSIAQWASPPRNTAKHTQHGDGFNYNQNCPLSPLP